MENEALKNLFLRGIDQIGLEQNPERLERVEMFWKEFSLWNRKAGLVRADARQLVVFHLLDSLAAIPHLPAAATVADVGSGGGFPGIPLAIFMEDVQFALLERSGKRAAFLRSAVARVGLPNVTVHEGDAGRHLQTYDLVTFRALGDFSAMYPLLLGLLNPAGRLAAYKGTVDQARKDAQFLPEGNRWRLQELKVPFSDRERHLLIVDNAELANEGHSGYR